MTVCVYKSHLNKCSDNILTSVSKSVSFISMQIPIKFTTALLTFTFLVCRKVNSMEHQQWVLRDIDFSAFSLLIQSEGD